jgi:hypothetical protein
MRFFVLVLECSPGAKSIEFVFDRKPEIEKYADATYEMVASAYATVLPDTFHKASRSWMTTRPRRFRRQTFYSSNGARA